MTKKSLCCGPGYQCPKIAMEMGPKEQVIFVTCPRFNSDKPDMIISVDVRPESEKYCKIVSRLDLPYSGDEIHHTGWNACSSCFGHPQMTRTHLIAPCLNSSRIYFIDARDPFDLKLTKCIEPEELWRDNVSFPHTSHCLANGKIMISTLGDKAGNAQCDFILIDGKTFEIDEKWLNNETLKPAFNYDFCTEWGHPNLIKNGFNLKDVQESKYGSKVHIWNFDQHNLKQTIELDAERGPFPNEKKIIRLNLKIRLNY